MKLVPRPRESVRASVRPKPSISWRPKRRRWHGWPPWGAPIARSRRNCSSAPRLSSTTSGRPFGNWMRRRGSNWRDVCRKWYLPLTVRRTRGRSKTCQVREHSAWIHPGPPYQRHNARSAPKRPCSADRPVQGSGRGSPRLEDRAIHRTIVRFVWENGGADTRIWTEDLLFTNWPQGARCGTERTHIQSVNELLEGPVPTDGSIFRRDPVRRALGLLLDLPDAEDLHSQPAQRELRRRADADDGDAMGSATRHREAPPGSWVILSAWARRHRVHPIEASMRWPVRERSREKEPRMGVGASGR